MNQYTCHICAGEEWEKSRLNLASFTKMERWLQLRREMAKLLNVSEDAIEQALSNEVNIYLERN